MSNITVLIADDEPTIRDLYTKAFANAGMIVITASTGAECVTQALEHHPDIILVDINMPDLDGHAAVSRIRADDWGANAKVIYLTNHSDPGNVVEAFNNKTDHYIVKANTTVKEVVNEARLAMHS